MDRLNFHQTVLDHLSEAVFACDLQENLTYMNLVAERLTGWPSWEAINKTMNEILPVAECAESKELLRNVLKTGRGCTRCKSTIVTRWNEDVEVTADLSPVYIGTQMSGVVLILHIPESIRKQFSERDSIDLDTPKKEKNS
jgi:PAS domain S-box-containing protein